MAVWAFINALALVIVSLLPVLWKLASIWYAAAALGTGCWLLVRAAQFLRSERRDFAARQLFFTTIAYLPILLGALVADRIFLPIPRWSVHDIPALNASLNALATILISCGFIFIKTGRVQAHRRVMTTAMVVSALFLVGYVTHKILIRKELAATGGHTPFGGHGAIATLYYAMLISHIILAMAIAYLVPRTFLLAIRGDFARHRAWARIVFPIWYYVSVTGVLVYFFPLPVVARDEVGRDVP